MWHACVVVRGSSSSEARKRKSKALVLHHLTHHINCVQWNWTASQRPCSLSFLFPQYMLARVMEKRKIFEYTTVIRKWRQYECHHTSRDVPGITKGREMMGRDGKSEFSGDRCSRVYSNILERARDDIRYRCLPSRHTLRILTRWGSLHCYPFLQYNNAKVGKILSSFYLPFLCCCHIHLLRIKKKKRTEGTLLEAIH